MITKATTKAVTGKTNNIALYYCITTFGLRESSSGRVFKHQLEFSVYSGIAYCAQLTETVLINKEKPQRESTEQSPYYRAFQKQSYGVTHASAFCKRVFEVSRTRASEDKEQCDFEREALRMGQEM